jgi:putative ABC transport system permease protein
MKRLFLNLRIAARSLYSFKLRSTLAILGVFLGTLSLIIVSNLSGSLSKKTEMDMAKFGKNLLVVQAGTMRRFGGGTQLLSEATTLTRADARVIAQNSPFVEEVSSLSSALFPLRYENTVLKPLPVNGVEANYPEIRNFYTREGAFITEQDNRKLNKVVVLGNRVKERLFGEVNPIGRYILVQRAPFQVIGVMEAKGADISGTDQDNQIFVPLNTYLRTLVNQDYITTILVRVTNSNSLAPAKSDIEEMLRKRHAIKPGKSDDFTVIDLKDVSQLQSQAMDTINTLGRISAIVSFLIGALGILSIMILMINERKMEIGIRRAVGSRKRDIVFQFLMESSFISLSGGMAGVIVGYGASILVFIGFNLPFSLSWTGFALGFSASVLTGVFAGIYPSTRATSIQPVDIIRS